MVQFNYDNNRDMWWSGSDPIKAVHDCAEFLRDVAACKTDPLARMEAVAHAWDVTLDGPGADAGVVLEVLRVFEQACHDAAKRPGVSAERRLRLRVMPLIWAAIIYHRLGYTRPAVTHAYTALCEIERFCGDREVVLEALASVVPNVVAELTIATITILGAALRRHEFADGESTRSRLIGTCRRVYGAYALHGRTPVIYPRTAAFAAQLLFLFAEQKDPKDAAIVDALRMLDDLTRPTHVRARATLGLRGHALALYGGDVNRADKLAKPALAPIRDFPLPRHVKRIDEQGYLD